MIQSKMACLKGAMEALDALLYVAQGNADFARQNTDRIVGLVDMVSVEAYNLHLDLDGMEPMVDHKPETGYRL